MQYNISYISSNLWLLKNRISSVIIKTPLHPKLCEILQRRSPTSSNNFAVSFVLMTKRSPKLRVYNFTSAEITKPRRDSLEGRRVEECITIFMRAEKGKRKTGIVSTVFQGGCSKIEKQTRNNNNSEEG